MQTHFRSSSFSLFLALLWNFEISVSLTFIEIQSNAVTNIKILTTLLQQRQPIFTTLKIDWHQSHTACVISILIESCGIAVCALALRVCVCVCKSTDMLNHWYAYRRIRFAKANREHTHTHGSWNWYLNMSMLLLLLQHLLEIITFIASFSCSAPFQIQGQTQCGDTIREFNEPRSGFSLAQNIGQRWANALFVTKWTAMTAQKFRFGFDFDSPIH